MKTPGHEMAARALRENAADLIARAERLERGRVSVAERLTALGLREAASLLQKRADDAAK